MNEQQKQQANHSEDMKRRIERMEGMMIESQKQVSLNLCLWCFICCVRDLTVSPLFSLWV